MSPPVASMRCGDLTCRPVGGALEQQVFEEVRRAGDLIALVAAPDADVGADGGRARLGHPLRDEADARGQFGVLDQRRVDCDSKGSAADEDFRLHTA